MSHWICQICEEPNHPMIIVLCGHTYCELCLDRVDTCPSCRTGFNRSDLQSNWALIDSKSQPLKRPRRDPDRELQDTVTRRTLLVKSLINRMVQKISDQLARQTQADPMAIRHRCKVKGLDRLMLGQLKEHLYRMHQGVTISKALLALDPPEIEVSLDSQPYQINAKRRRTGFLNFNEPILFAPPPPMDSI